MSFSAICNAQVDFAAFSDRLKSCPVTKQKNLNILLEYVAAQVLVFHDGGDHLLDVLG